MHNIFMKTNTKGNAVLIIIVIVALAVAAYFIFMWGKSPSTTSDNAQSTNQPPASTSPDTENFSAGVAVPGNDFGQVDMNLKVLGQDSKDIDKGINDVPVTQPQ